MDKKQKKHEYYLKLKSQWNKASKAWYQRNKKKVLEEMKEDRKLRPEFWKARRNKWNNEHRQQIAKSSQERQKRMRVELLEKLGNKCIICGETNQRYLHLDRVKGGYHHRTMYWVKKHITEFQILCANHHNEKTCYKEIIWKGKNIRF